jgi:hypothetical protein
LVLIHRGRDEIDGDGDEGDDECSKHAKNPEAVSVEASA